MASDTVGSSPSIAYMHNPPILMADVTGMSKLARQLGLPSSHRRCGRRASCGPWNSRCGRRRPRKVSLRSPQAHDRRRLRHRVGSIQTGTDGAQRSSTARCASQSPASSPDRQGADRLLELEGRYLRPHSHLFPPLIDPERRHKIVVGAAADYFFGTASPVPCRHSVSGQSRSNGRRPAQERRPRRRTHRRRLESPDLPEGGRSLTAGVSRSAVVPPIWLPSRRAGRAGARCRHGPDLPRALALPDHLGDLRSGDHPAGNENDPLRRPNRRKSLPSREATTDGPRSPASPPDRQPIAHRTRGRAVACLGAGRPQPSGPQPPEALAGDLDQAESWRRDQAVGPIRRAVPIQHRGARTSPCASRTPSQ